MHNPRAALRLAAVYTVAAVSLLAGSIVMGEDGLPARLTSFAVIAAILWLGWLWMYVAYRR